MATSKTLFDAVEAELRNARAAISNASTYLDMLKDTVKEIYNSARMEAPLSVSADKDVTDFIVKTENGEYGIPIAVDSEDESIIHILKVRDVSTELKEHMKL